MYTCAYIKYVYTGIYSYFVSFNLYAEFQEAYKVKSEKHASKG